MERSRFSRLFAALTLLTGALVASNASSHVAVAAEPGNIVVSPNVGLVDGQEVVLSATGWPTAGVDGRILFVIQCAIGASGSDPSCDTSTQRSYPLNSVGDLPSSVQFTVKQTLAITWPGNPTSWNCTTSPCGLRGAVYAGDVPSPSPSWEAMELPGQNTVNFAAQPPSGTADITVEPNIGLPNSSLVQVSGSGWTTGGVALVECVGPDSATCVVLLDSTPVIGGSFGPVSVTVNRFVNGHDAVAEGAQLVALWPISQTPTESASHPLTFAGGPGLPAPQIIVDPSSDLYDGQIVTVSNYGATSWPENTDLTIVQCAVASLSGGPPAGCDESTLSTITTGTGGTFSEPFRIQRYLHNGQGSWDCVQQQPNTCALVVTDVSLTIRATASIRMVGNYWAVQLQPDADLIDGQLVTLTGHNFPPYGVIQVQQCAAFAMSPTTCSRQAVSPTGLVVVDAFGAFEAEYPVQRQPRNPANQPVACDEVDACNLIVTVYANPIRGGFAAAVIHNFKPWPQHALVAVTDTTDLIDDGAPVTLRGQGFSPGVEVKIYRCEFGGDSAAESFGFNGETCSNVDGSSWLDTNTGQPVRGPDEYIATTETDGSFEITFGVPKYPVPTIQECGTTVLCAFVAMVIDGYQSATSDLAGNGVRVQFRTNSLRWAYGPIPYPERVAMETSPGSTLFDVRPVNHAAPSPAAPAGVTFPLGMLHFKLHVPTGGTATVTITPPAGTAAARVNAYFKLVGDNWLPFAGSSVGPGGVTTLTLTDGGAGDGDSLANGVISDPGAPAIVSDDNDGVSVEVENGAPNSGDGNSDGIKDWLQPTVTSLESLGGTGPYVTLESPAGTTLGTVATIDPTNPALPDLPDGVDFPAGLVDFTVNGVTTTDPIEVKLYVDGGVSPSAFWKYQSGVWSDYTANTDLSGNSIVITLQDRIGGSGGQAGLGDDNDAAGVIHDPGGPGVAANTPPMVTPIPNRSIDEDGSTGWMVFLIGDAETPWWGLTLTAESSDTLIVPNANIDLIGVGPIQLIRVTPAGNENGGPVEIVVSVSDGTTSTLKSFLVTVAPVNDEPSFVAGSNRTVAEDSGAQAVTGWNTLRSAGPTNESGQVLSFIVTDNNTGLFSARPAISPTGTLTFTPAPDANGSAIVSVRIHDDGGTANGGDDTSGVQTFTITVTPVPDTPVASPVTTSTSEDTATSIPLTGTDVDGSNTTFTVLSGPAHGSVSLGARSCSGVATRVCTRTATYAPASNYNGQDSFTYRVNDGTSNSSAATVTIIVNAVNDGPTLSNITNKSVQRNHTISFNVTVGDIDDPLSSLALSGTSSVQARVADANLAFNGSEGTRVVSISAGHQVGATSVRITVTDPHGATAIRTFIVNVTQ